MRITVLDQDRNQAELICEALSAARHACHRHDDRTDLPEHLQRVDCDLLIIDARVTDAIAGLRAARDAQPGLPVLFLAGRADSDLIAAALTAGANDYLITPIRRSELLTRVQVLLRRAYPEQDAPQQERFGPYTFELGSGRVAMTGRTVELTQKEFELALLLFRYLDRPLSRAFIREKIWSRDDEVPSRTVDTHVSRVRSKLALRPENGFRLLPVYSYGYRLEQLLE